MFINWVLILLGVVAFLTGLLAELHRGVPPEGYHQLNIADNSTVVVDKKGYLRIQ